MTSRAFLHANILIYAAVTDNRRSETAAGLLECATTSVQAFNEFVDVSRRKLRLEWDKIAASLATFNRLLAEVTPVTSATFAVGFDIARRHQFRIYDSLIVASALEAGCETLFTEDMQHGQIIDRRLTVSNPFR